MIDIKINQILYVFLYIPDIYCASRYQNMYNVKRYQSIGIFCSQPNRYIYHFKLSCGYHVYGI